MKKTLFAILFIFCFVFTSRAVVRTVIASGNWSNSAIWSGNRVPGNKDDAVIPAGFTVTVDANENPKTLTVSGTLTFSGAFSITLVNKGFLTTNSGSVLIFANGGQIAGGGNGGNGVTITINDGTSITTDDANGININTGTGSITINPGGTTTTYGPGVNYTYNGTVAQITGDAVFNANNFTISNTAGVTATNALSVTNLTINGSTSLDMGVNDLVIGSSVTNSGTLFTQSVSATPISSGYTWGGTVQYNSTSAQTIVTGTYTNLTLSNAGTKTLAGNTTVTSVLTNNTGSTLDAATATLTLSGTGTPLVNSGTFTPSTSTVLFSGNGATNIAAENYYNLTLSTASTKTLAGNTTVSNVLTNNTGSTLNASSFTLTLSGSGTPLINSGTFIPATSTVNYTNAGATTITALNYYNINASGGNRTFSNTGTIGVANVFTPGAGTYTITNSTVDFNGSGSQTIPAFTFYFLKVSNAGIKYIPASTTVICQTIDVNGSAGVEINADGGGQLNVIQ